MNGSGSVFIAHQMDLPRTVQYEGLALALTNRLNGERVRQGEVARGDERNRGEEIVLGAVQPASGMPTLSSH